MTDIELTDDPAPDEQINAEPANDVVNEPDDAEPDAGNPPTDATVEP